MLSIKYTLTAFAAVLLAATAVSQAPTVFHGPMTDAGGKILPPPGETSLALCFGDGTGAPCPAGNNGAPGHGCDNSVGAGGGLLWVTGQAQVSNDTLQLNVNGLPKKTSVLYMQGTLGPGKGGGRAFGDGLLCLSGSIVKLGTSQVLYGTDLFPDPADAFSGSLHSLGGIPPSGGTRYYQALYRDEYRLGTGATFNLTNAWMQVWVP